MTENVQNLWKCSSFTNIFNINENVLLFSSINSRLLKFTPEQFEIIQTILDSVRDTGTADNMEILELLAAQSFIVPLGFDEREDAHRKYLSTINSDKHLIIIISPTMKCNFSCSYCFEKNAVKCGEMSKEVQEKLITLVERKISAEGKLDIQWFGGEPYLAFEVIEYLTGRFQKICKKNGATYEAGIVTNGSLLDSDNISQLNRLNITNIQITLDGTPETFARRKGISLLESKEFYSRIFSQIPLLLQQLKVLSIRINIDRDNYEEAFYVVQELKKRSLNDAKIDLRLGLLEGKSNIVDCIPHSCLSTEEYLEFDLRFKEYLAQEGFSVYGFPVPLPYPCATVKKQSYSIDPSGNIYHCVPETGQGAGVYGNLNEADEIKSNEYQGFDPWTIPACRDCSLLPICLGRCPRRQKYENPYKCITRFKLAERLLLYSNFAKSV